MKVFRRPMVLSSWALTPKSTSFTSAFSVKRTFWPLISRWMTLCLCKCCKPWNEIQILSVSCNMEKEMRIIYLESINPNYQIFISWCTDAECYFYSKIKHYSINGTYDRFAIMQNEAFLISQQLKKIKMQPINSKKNCSNINIMKLFQNKYANWQNQHNKETFYL